MRRLLIVAVAFVALALAVRAYGEPAKAWTEIIQNGQQCRWERHSGVRVVSVGQWHRCDDRELGA